MGDTISTTTITPTITTTTTHYRGPNLCRSCPRPPAAAVHSPTNTTALHHQPTPGTGTIGLHLSVNYSYAAHLRHDKPTPGNRYGHVHYRAAHAVFGGSTTGCIIWIVMIVEEGDMYALHGRSGCTTRNDEKQKIRIFVCITLHRHDTTQHDISFVTPYVSAST